MQSLAALRALASISAGQWGMVTTAQAAGIGVGRVQLARLVEGAFLERLAHGVYKETGSAPDEFVEMRAAWLSTDPKNTAENRLRQQSEIVVSGNTAAHLYGFGDFQPEPYSFASTTRRQSQRPEIRYRHRAYQDEDVVIVHGLPVTTVERTIADLVRDREDLSLVADVLAAAVRASSVRLDVLASHLGPLAVRNGHPPEDGRALLDQLLEITGIDAASQLRRIASGEMWWKAVDQSVKGKLLSAVSDELMRSFRQDFAKLLTPSIGVDLSKMIRDAVGVLDLKAILANSFEPVDPSASVGAEGGHSRDRVIRINSAASALKQLEQLPRAEAAKVANE
jgi:hypothetical protein